MNRFQLSLSSLLLLCAAVPIWLFLIVAVPRSSGWGGSSARFFMAPIVLTGINMENRFVADVLRPGRGLRRSSGALCTGRFLWVNHPPESVDDGEHHNLAAGEGPEMIHYIAGQEARVGDTVLIDNGERTGVVEDVIDGDVKLQQWGVDEPGVMIKSEYYGLRFLCTEEIRHEEVRLLSRSME